MKVIHHMSINVDGAIRNKAFGIFNDDSGGRLTKKEGKAFLLTCQFEGKRVIPMSSEPCEGFSYQTGCPGHPVSEGEQPKAK